MYDFQTKTPEKIILILTLRKKGYPSFVCCFNDQMSQAKQTNPTQCKHNDPCVNTWPCLMQLAVVMIWRNI